jgi:hypothetical protein
MGIFHVLIYYLIHFPPCLTSAQAHGHLRLILTDPWPLRNNNNKKTISKVFLGLGGNVHLFRSQLCSCVADPTRGFCCMINHGGRDNKRSSGHAFMPQVTSHTDSEKFRQARQLPNLFYADTTFHIFATPSSPTVAIKSSYPFLGHHVIEFTSLTSCAFSRRAISLYLGGLRCVESGSSWDHTSQNPATHTARCNGSSPRTPKH